MGSSRNALLALMLLFLLCLAPGAGAQTYPDRNRQAVVDAANVIPDDEEASLNARLIEWANSSGNQLAVVTVPSLEGRSVEDYGVGLLRHWGLGNRESRGAILILAPTERKLRIEVGYGLEGVLTDAATSAILRDVVRPTMRAGDTGRALSDGADQIMQIVTPDAAAAPGDNISTAYDTPAAALSSADTMESETDHTDWWIRTIFFWIVGLIVGGLVLLFLWPVITDWYFFWPFTVILPRTTQRLREKAEAEEAAREAEKKAKQEEWDRQAAERVAKAIERYGPNYHKRANWDSLQKRMLSPTEMRARAEKRAKRARRSSSGSSSWGSSSGGGSSSSYDSGSSSSGFDSGGGSGGGGGSSSDY